MAFLPVVSVSRSQSVRLGRGPGVTVVPQIGMGDEPFNVQSGGLNVLFYANLNDGNTRKDYQHHSAIGALDSVGTLSQGLNTTAQPNSDLVVPAAPTVVAGSGLSINVPTFLLQGRTFGGTLETTAVTNLPLQSNSSGLSRTDAVCVDYTGRIFVIAGIPAAATAFEVDTVSQTGGSAGTLTLGYTYNGAFYTTTPLGYLATAANVAAAIKAAGNLPGTWTGSGGPLGTGTVTVTNTVTGVALSGQTVVANNVTGGTVTFAQTTQGNPGPQVPVVGGVSQTIATVVVANAASSPGTITNSIAPTS